MKYRAVIAVDFESDDDAQAASLAVYLKDTLDGRSSYSAGNGWRGRTDASMTGLYTMTQVWKRGREVAWKDVEAKGHAGEESDV